MFRRTLLLAVAFGVGAIDPTGSAVADSPFPPEVQSLLGKLDDADPAVRRDAVGQLRLLARRADVKGGKREQRGPEFPPKVGGLVPHLVRATRDRVEANRVAALHALADTRDRAALPVIRERLQDASESVRFHAACFLTEFKDASGLDELRKALARFRAKPKSAGPFDVERLLASLERITGKGFGEIPMNPSISSDSRVAAASERRYRELLDTWAAWWEWVPPRK